MKINEPYVCREIMGDYVIVPVGKATETLNGMIITNEVGAFLWDLLRQGTTEEAMVQAVLADFAVEEATARDDVHEFLQKLYDNGILKGEDHAD